MSDKINFETSLKSLEDVVSRLEKGECSLEESISLFEKGMANVKECSKALKEAEIKINTLGEGE